MKVYIVMHNWCYEHEQAPGLEDGQRIEGAFLNRSEAAEFMKMRADKERAQVAEDWGKPFDADFCWDSEDYTSWGWHNVFDVDYTWSWELTEVEVRE